MLRVASPVLDHATINVGVLAQGLFHLPDIDAVAANLDFEVRATKESSVPSLK